MLKEGSVEDRIESAFGDADYKNWGYEYVDEKRCVKEKCKVRREGALIIIGRRVNTRI